MPCDALSYYFVCRELDSMLSGGRIEKVNMPEPDEIFFTVRAERKTYILVVSAGNYPRVHITKSTKENPLTPPSLCMNLRKNLGGGLIKSITQLPDERVLFIDVLCRDELGVKTDRRLVCEIMGKYSNVILLEGDRILECMRHIPLDISAKRQLLPGLKYTAPQQDKLSPTDTRAIAALDFSVNPYGTVFGRVMGLAQSSINEALHNAASASDFIEGSSVLEGTIAGDSAASGSSTPTSSKTPLVGEEIRAEETMLRSPLRHCEERGDAAIHGATTPTSSKTLPVGEAIHAEKTILHSPLHHCEERGDAAIHYATTPTPNNTPPVGGKIANAIKDLFDMPLNPCVLTGEKGDFFIRPYKSLDGEYAFFDTLNAAMDFFYAEKDIKSRLTAKSKNLTVIVKNALRRAEKRLAEFYSRINESGDFESDRILGDLITANIHKITAGMTTLVTSNFYSENGEDIQIPIDPLLSPAANAQKHYKKYAKKKRTLSASQELAGKAEIDKKACEELLYSLSCLTSASELTDIAEEMAALSLIKPLPRRKNEKPSAPRSTEVDGFRIFIGKNNVQNERLYKSAAKNDIWLHAKHHHGSHVVIESEGRAVPEPVILSAAAFAAYYSGGGDSPKVEVDYTLIKNVSKQPGGGPGKVFYRGQQTVVVQPKPV